MALARSAWLGGFVFGSWIDLITSASAVIFITSCNPSCAASAALYSRPALQ
jgi:hypothetical protein